MRRKLQSSSWSRKLLSFLDVSSHWEPALPKVSPDVRKWRLTAILPIVTSLVTVLIGFTYLVLTQKGLGSAEKLQKIAASSIITASMLASSIFIQMTLTSNRGRSDITAHASIRRQERTLLRAIEKEVRSALRGEM
jgi:hypothetical protein